MPQDSPDDLIGSAEAARIIGIDRSTFSRWALYQKVDQLRPAVVLPGDRRIGARLFRRADILVVAAEHAAKKAGAA